MRRDSERAGTAADLDDELAARIAHGTAQWLADHRPPAIVAATIAASIERWRLVPAATWLTHARTCFELDDIEALVVRAVIAIERDPNLRAACALGAALGQPTVSSLSAVLGISPRWSRATAALIRYGVVAIDPAAGSVASVRAAPGFVALLEELSDPLAPPTPGWPPPPELTAAIARSATWLAAGTRRVVAIVGAPGTGRDTIGHAIAHTSGRPLVAVPEPDAREVATICRLHWHQAIALVNDASAAAALIDRDVPVIAVMTHAPIAELSSRAEIHVLEVPLPTPAWRATWWHRHAGQLPSLGLGRRFGPERVRTASQLARTRGEVLGRVPSPDDLAWACRTVAAGDFGRLAHRLQGAASRTDLIVPIATARDLDRAMRAASSAWHVAERWSADGRGAWSGLAFLLAGPPGTGKSMCARVFGHELGRDVFRVDLSQMIDKYVGETEKHLDQLFACAADVECILFFDEADALFGARSQGDDSHARYHNQTIGFLLQRIEDHPGIVLLATNRRDQLDAAFARRMHAVIEFPAPGPAERVLLWRRYLPTDVCPDDVDFFAQRFALTGAEIRKAALSAELAAVTDGRPVTTLDACLAVWSVLHAAGRLMSVDDFGPWRDSLLPLVRGERP